MPYIEDEPGGGEDAVTDDSGTLVGVTLIEAGSDLEIYDSPDGADVLPTTPRLLVISRHCVANGNPITVSVPYTTGLFYVTKGPLAFDITTN